MILCPMCLYEKTDKTKFCSENNFAVCKDFQVHVTKEEVAELWTRIASLEGRLEEITRESVRASYFKIVLKEINEICEKELKDG